MNKDQAMKLVEGQELLVKPKKVILESISFGCGNISALVRGKKGKKESFDIGDLELPELNRYCNICHNETQFYYVDEESVVCSNCGAPDFLG